MEVWLSPAFAALSRALSYFSGGLALSLALAALSAAYPECNLSNLLPGLSQGFAALSLGFPVFEFFPGLSQEKAWLSQALPACKNGLNCS